VIVLLNLLTHRTNKAVSSLYFFRKSFSIGVHRAWWGRMNKGHLCRDLHGFLAQLDQAQTLTFLFDNAVHEEEVKLSLCGSGGPRALGAGFAAPPSRPI
jgi:hypothetical protein